MSAHEQPFSILRERKRLIGFEAIEQAGPDSVECPDSREVL